MSNSFKMVWVIFTYIMLTKTHETQSYEKDTVEDYCTSFSSCWDCKKAGIECDWCHEIGCTHYASLHCPQKINLDNAHRKNSQTRFCTEIVSADPVFVPANIGRSIKLNLRIDDLTLYKRNIVCEIHLEQSIVRLKGSLSVSTLFCNMATLRIERSITLGYVRLLWGGAVPHSNTVMMVVYKCELMASDCMKCQALDKRFNCGWCHETSNCILIEQCPRQTGQTVDRKSSCSKFKDNTFYFNGSISPGNVLV